MSWGEVQFVFGSDQFSQQMATKITICMGLLKCGLAGPVYLGARMR